MNAISQFHHIETARLRLRPLGAVDVEALADQAGDLGVARMTTGLPHPYRIDHAHMFLNWCEQLDPRRETVFAIERRGMGLAGVLGFHPAKPLQPELGYWFGRGHWGEGLATEAVRAAMAWASSCWGRRMAVAGHFADNPASARVLEKAGFLYTGEVQARYSLARQDDAPTRMMVWLA